MQTVAVSHVEWIVLLIVWMGLVLLLASASLIEQIGNIIILVKNKLELIITYTVEEYKISVEKELLERNYDIETIKNWLAYID